jgi:hypothetical protein
MPTGDILNPKKTLSPSAFLLALTVSSCAGTAQPVPPGPAVPVATPTLTLASREAARTVELLTKLLVIDRRAVELSEQRLAHARDLANAGRLGEPDVISAELELLKLKQQLLVREQELADAQQSAGAGDRPQRPITFERQGP